MWKYFLWVRTVGIINSYNQLTTLQIKIPIEHYSKRYSKVLKDWFHLELCELIRGHIDNEKCCKILFPLLWLCGGWADILICCQWFYFNLNTINFKHIYVSMSFSYHWIFKTTGRFDIWGSLRLLMLMIMMKKT